MSSRLHESVITQMHNEYMCGLRLIDVALKHGYADETTLCYHFKRHNLFTRPRGGAIKLSQKGCDNGNWKGGRVQKSRGYILIWNPTHHRADTGGYVTEHTLVVEKKLDRLLRNGEIIHHINGDKNDNCHENLRVMTQSQHRKIHEKELQKWRKKV